MPAPTGPPDPITASLQLCRLSSFNLGGAADKQGSGSGNSHSSGGSGSTLAGKSRSAAMERDRDLLEGQHSLGGTHLSTEDGAGDDDDLSDQPFEEVEEMDLPEARDDEQEDEEEQGEGLEPVQDVMDDLAQCQTLECLKPIHARLAGRTPFNLPHFFIVGWQKCATTSVVMHLRKHPQMLYSLSGVKESHYWSVCEKYPDKAICKVRSCRLRRCMHPCVAACMGWTAFIWKNHPFVLLAVSLNPSRECGHTPPAQYFSCSYAWLYFCSCGSQNFLSLPVYFGTMHCICVHLHIFIRVCLY